MTVETSKDRNFLNTRTVTSRLYYSRYFYIRIYPKFCCSVIFTRRQIHLKCGSTDLTSSKATLSVLWFYVWSKISLQKKKWSKINSFKREKKNKTKARKYLADFKIYKLGKIVFFRHKTLKSATNTLGLRLF